MLDQNTARKGREGTACTKGSTSPGPFGWQGKCPRRTWPYSASWVSEQEKVPQADSPPPTHSLALQHGDMCHGRLALSPAGTATTQTQSLMASQGAHQSKVRACTTSPTPTPSLLQPISVPPQPLHCLGVLPQELLVPAESHLPHTPLVQPQSRKFSQASSRSCKCLGPQVLAPQAPAPQHTWPAGQGHPTKSLPQLNVAMCCWLSLPLTSWR